MNGTQKDLFQRFNEPPPAEPYVNILLVDDRKENLDLLETILKPLGHNLVRATSGRDALRILASDDFAIVLMDVQMPGMSGFETVDRFRELDRSAEPAIIYITAADDEQYMRKGYASGAMDYIRKPLEPAILQFKVSAFVDLYRNKEKLVSHIAARKAAEEILSKDFDRERRIAETLKRSLLWTVPEDHFNGITVASAYQVCSDEADFGGDFLDSFTLESGKIALVLGDITGHGLDAAAFVAEVKYSLRAFLRDSSDPRKALDRLNAMLCGARGADDPEPARYPCLTLAVIEPVTGLVELTVAGMERPMIIGTHGGAATVDVSGLPLGVIPEEHYLSKRVVLAPGETLVLATDGVTEARNMEKEFGPEGIIRLPWKNLLNASLPAAAQAILDKAREHTGGQLRDDACVLLVRLNSSAEREAKPPRLSLSTGLQK